MSPPKKESTMERTRLIMHVPYPHVVKQHPNTLGEREDGKCEVRHQPTVESSHLNGGVFH